MNNINKLKILFTTNIPAPYMVEYLHYLGKKCNLTVLFEMNTAGDRVSQWYGKVEQKSFHFVFLNAIGVNNETGLSFKVLKYLNKNYDRIIIANPTTPTGVLSILYCKLKGIKFIIQSEGGFQGSGKGFKEKFKKYLMRGADIYLTGMKGDSEYFLSYGATKEKLRWYPFSSLEQSEIDKKVITFKEKEKIKKQLGIYEKCVIISVGRSIYCKGFDTLLRAKSRLNNDIGFYIVGGTIKEEYKQIINEKNLKNVHFIDHCNSETLKMYYHSSDIFVLATRGDTWGLVINEAMANGLPVITTNRCIAGMQLIENDINGYIIPVDDINALSKKINILLENDDLRKYMAENNLRKIQPYYIKNMANYIFDNIYSL